MYMYVSTYILYLFLISSNLSIYLCVYLCVYLSIYLPIYLPTSLYLSIYTSYFWMKATTLGTLEVQEPPKVAPGTLANLLEVSGTKVAELSEASCYVSHQSLGTLRDPLKGRLGFL